MKTQQTLEFTDATFREQVLESDAPVLVDFWAPWCGPCLALAPTIEELAEQYSGNAKVGKLNVDENPETASGYGIRSIPSILLFDRGEVVERFVGIQPKERYASAVAAVVGVGSETQ